MHFKGGYLEFSYLPELKKIYITEIYMKQEDHDGPISLTLVPSSKGVQRL